MPSYSKHSRWGRFGAVLTAAVVGGALFAAFDSAALAFGGAVGAGVSTFVGSIFPDIDHSESVPRQKAVRGVQILLWLGVVALAVLSWDLLVEGVGTSYVEPAEQFLANTLGSTVAIPHDVATIGIVLLVAIGLAGIVDPAFCAITFEHRGWTHNVWVMFGLTALLAGGIWLLTSGTLFPQVLPLERKVLVLSAVAAFFFGILIHLGMDDEID